MIVYNNEEIKKAIIKTIPVGTIINRDNITDIKWMIILGNGFDKRGWLYEDKLLSVFGMLRNDERFERHRSRETGKRFYVRIK